MLTAGLLGGHPAKRPAPVPPRERPPMPPQLSIDAIPPPNIRLHPRIRTNGPLHPTLPPARHRLAHMGP